MTALECLEELKKINNDFEYSDGENSYSLNRWIDIYTMIESSCDKNEIKNNFFVKNNEMCQKNYSLPKLFIHYWKPLLNTSKSFRQGFLDCVDSYFKDLTMLERNIISEMKLATPWIYWSEFNPSSWYSLNLNPYDNGWNWGKKHIEEIKKNLKHNHVSC